MSWCFYLFFFNFYFNVIQWSFVSLKHISNTYCTFDSPKIWSLYYFYATISPKICSQFPTEFFLLELGKSILTSSYRNLKNECLLRALFSIYFDSCCISIKKLGFRRDFSSTKIEPYKVIFFLLHNIFFFWSFFDHKIGEKYFKTWNIMESQIILGKMLLSFCNIKEKQKRDKERKSPFYSKILLLQ